MTRQKGKGMKRKRGWHRSKRSAKVFDTMLKKLERGEKQMLGEKNEQV